MRKGRCWVLFVKIHHLLIIRFDILGFLDKIIVGLVTVRTHVIIIIMSTLIKSTEHLVVLYSDTNYKISAICVSMLASLRSFRTYLPVYQEFVKLILPSSSHRFRDGSRCHLVPSFAHHIWDVTVMPYPILPTLAWRSVI